MTFRRKVAAGERPALPSALMHNELESSTRFARDKWNENQGSQSPQSMYRPSAFTGWIRNNTGADLNTLEIVGLDDPVISGETNKWEFAKNYTINASVPDEEKHASNFAVAMQPIASGRIGRVCLDGLSAALVDVLNLTDQFATVSDNDVTKLVSSSDKGFRIVTKPANLGEQYCIIDIGSGGGGGGGPTVIEFTVDAAFSEPNDSVGATVTKVWSGSEASASVMVYNTCNMFAGNAGDCGVAISNAEDGGRYQIIQLRCPDTIVSDQKFWFDVGQGDSISYAGAPTPIPYSFEGAGSLGDLLTLEADGSLTFARDPTGPVTIGLFALISDILGIGSDGDKSILQVDYDDLGGGGYQTLPTATAVQHPYFRVPPNDYGMGGSTSIQWTTSLGGTGHKLRVTVQTANGNTVSTQFLQSYFQVSES